MRRRGIDSEEVGITSSPKSLNEFKLDSELRDLKKILDSTIKSSIDLGADLSEMGNYEESQELMGVLKDLIRLERTTRQESALANDFTMRIRCSSYEEGGGILNSLKELNENDQMRINWKNAEELKEYNELTWECGPGYGNRQAYPAIVDDDEDVDDGLVMQTRDSLICPISQGLLKDPVRNAMCNHSYSKTMIEGLFHSETHATIQCPVSGCRGTVTRRNLIPDEKLGRKLKRAEDRIFK